MSLLDRAYVEELEKHVKSLEEQLQRQNPLLR